MIDRGHLSDAVTKTRERTESNEGTGFTYDEVLTVLSNQRRRFVLHFLKRNGHRPVSLRDLSDQVASWEYDKPIEQINYKERKRVQNALRQFHLPKLADHGFVEYDTQRKTVGLTDAAENRDFYIDVVPNRDIPWSLYYLAFSALSAVGLAGSWFGVVPFSAIDPLLLGVFFVTTIGFSSLAHVYDSYYRMRFGSRKRPPEIK